MDHMREASGYDAIVLAGGAGRRLGGVDKASVLVGDRSLLDRVLQALAGAGRIVVVGPPRTLPPGVLSTSEHPPGGGPVAAVAAGLELVRAPLVTVLACDLPFVTAETVARLAAPLTADGAATCDGAHLLDEGARRQPLTAVYRTLSLRAAVAALDQVWGSPMRGLIAGLLMVDVRASAGQAWDCDTWNDVDRARRRAAENLVEGS